ncbi:hypothetical protein V2W45_1035645 [Cenococcum geophilum]
MWGPPLNDYEIRLLKLLPEESADSIICCTLFRSSVDNHLPYKALSYAWGATRKSNSIILNGQPYKVTANLDYALRQARRTGQRLPLWVWVDALCIN